MKILFAPPITNGMDDWLKERVQRALDELNLGPVEAVERSGDFLSDFSDYALTVGLFRHSVSLPNGETDMLDAKKTMRAIKGFDANLKCRDFQFEAGKTYKHEGAVRACESGFHAIAEDANPLAVFQYYPPAGSRFFRVELSGALHSDDGEKTAAEILTVGSEIGLKELAEEAVAWITARATEKGMHTEGYRSASTSTGDQSASTSTGYRSASTSTGYRSASTSTGDRSASTSTGYQSASTSTGDQSASTSTGYRSASTSTGDQSASTSTGYRSASTSTGDRSASTSTGDQSASTSTGDQSASTSTGYRSASTSTGDQSASTSTGDQSASTSTGYRSASTSTGYRSASTSTGDQSAAMSCGREGRVRASKFGSALFAVERDDDWNIMSVACGIVGQDGIDPDVWYTCQGGKLVAVEA